MEARASREGFSGTVNNILAAFLMIVWVCLSSGRAIFLVNLISLPLALAKVNCGYGENSGSLNDYAVS